MDKSDKAAVYAALKCSFYVENPVFLSPFINTKSH